MDWLVMRRLATRTARSGRCPLSSKIRPAGGLITGYRQFANRDLAETARENNQRLVAPRGCHPRLPRLRKLRLPIVTTSGVEPAFGSQYPSLIPLPEFSR